VELLLARRRDAHARRTVEDQLAEMGRDLGFDFFLLPRGGAASRELGWERFIHTVCRREDIPLAARIVKIAGAYGAMTPDREPEAASQH
jgi:hypothetical protein